MVKFMMVYSGEATDLSEMTPEEGQAVLQKWNSWMGNVGSALVDIGSPFGAGRSVVDDGSSGEPASLTGYSIVEASDLDAAHALTEGHPYLAEGAGNYSIELYELAPVPFEN